MINGVEKLKILKKFEFFKFAHLTLAIIPILGLTASVCSIAADFSNQNGDNRYIKNMLYVDTHLKLKEGDFIKVNLYNFNEEETKLVKEAIKEIDSLSSKLNYVFSDESNIQTKRILNIRNNREFDNPTIVGRAVFNYNQVTGDIEFPLNIYLRKGLINGFYEKDPSIKLLSYAVKHEVMHTLGFNDLRTDRWLGKSIMYYNADIASDYEVTGITEQDKNDIINCYGGLAGGKDVIYQEKMEEKN